MKRSFNIRELDDGTFILCVNGEDIGESEESAYDSIDELLEDIRNDLSERVKKKKPKSEIVEKITKGEEDEDEE